MNGTNKIYESFDTGRSICGNGEEESAYEDMKNLYEQKLEIKEDIEKWLGQEYNIDLFSINRAIKVKTNKSLENEVKNNYFELKILYNKIESIINKTNIYVEIEYRDGSLAITKGSKIEENYTINQILKTK